MTNNQTIDGVSLLPCPLCGSNDVLLAWDVYDTDRGRRTQSQIRCLGCRILTKTFNTHADARSYWNNRPMLDAPAVERKPKGAILRFREYVGKGQGGRDLWRDWTEWSTGTVEYAKSKLDQTKDLTHIQFEVEWLYSDTPEVAALQSTIARLEARIAELESGRGEPIYEQRYGGGWINIGLEEYKRCLEDPEEASSLRIVFTAPPAPVAVVDKYDDVLLPFLAMMRNELHANAGKGDRPGWLSMTPGECVLEIYYHLGKLQKGVKDGNELWITEYSADVANMAMMLADICGLLDATAALNGVKP